MKALADYKYYEDELVTLYCGDVRDVLPLLPEGIVQCCVTSPPYFGLRNYNVDGQIGLEPSPQDFIDAMVDVFGRVRRVMRKDGVAWVNLGDSYAGSGKGLYADGNCYLSDKSAIQKTNIGSMGVRMRTKEGDPGHTHGVKPPEGFKSKDLMLIPHRVAMALQEAGWWLRQAMPWVKTNPMPESVTDRPANALEYVFQFAKSAKYFCDMFAVRKTQAPSSVARLAQDVESQTGSTRANGGAKTNGNMKAVGQPANWKGSSFSKGKTAEHQLNRSQSDESRASRDRSFDWSRNGEGGHLDTRPAGSRNFRNADLWFESVEKPYSTVGVGEELVGLNVNPQGFKDAHFATFPPRLVEPLIKMGTSEKGQCAKCGAPWTPDTDADKELRGQIGFAAHGKKTACAADYRMLGWSPSCKCGTDETEPQIVLDPFAGAGTTGVVAKRMGRRSILIELNPEYCEIIVRRLQHYHKPAPPPTVSPDADVLPLFSATVTPIAEVQQ